MTAIVNTTTDPLQNSTTTLTPTELHPNVLSVPPLENLTKSITQSLPLQPKSSNLLKKRHNSANLEDLVVKKIKTQSTNCSDSESLQQSFTSNRKTSSKTFPSLSRSGSFESVVEKDDDFMLEEDFSMEGLTLVDQASKGLFYIPPLENNLSIPSFNHKDLLEDEPAIPALMDINIPNIEPLQQSLEILKNQLLIAQFNDFLVQNVFQEPKRFESNIRIPPFVPLSETKVEIPLLKLRKERANKRLPKKTEEEMAITYGAVEFPFLSISTQFENSNTQTQGLNLSTPLPELNLDMFSDKKDETSLINNENVSKKRKYTKLHPVFKICKATQENKKQETKANKKEEKIVKAQKIGKVEKKVVIEQKKPQIKKPSPIKNTNNANQNNQSQKNNKKSVKEEAKSPMEIEETTQKESKEKQDFLYFHFNRRRGEERKKNRWQVSQDIKLGDLQIPLPTLSSSYSTMFEGNKKKSSLIPVGDEYQVDVVFSLTKMKENKPRQPKLKWDPSLYKESEIQRFFKEVETIVDVNINQEKILKYLLKNENDIRKTKKYIKDNKGKVSQDLLIKALE